MPFPEQIRQGPLVPDHDVSDEIGDDELHLRLRRWVNHAAFEDQTSQPEPRLGGIGRVLFKRVGGSDVEHQLVLEVVEHDHHKPCEAAESQSVGPEAPRLELPGARADVDGLPRAWRHAARR